MQFGEFLGVRVKFALPVVCPKGLLGSNPEPSDIMPKSMDHPTLPFLGYQDLGELISNVEEVGCG